MAVKVAVASRDGINVNEHFGRARRFLIYQLSDGKWTLLEDRESRPPCEGQEHHEDMLERAADAVSDCQGVVVEQIGIGAIDALVARRILPFRMCGTIESGLAELQKSRQFRGDEWALRCDKLLNEYFRRRGHIVSG